MTTLVRTADKATYNDVGLMAVGLVVDGWWFPGV
jgi:hypothetical protein